MMKESVIRILMTIAVTMLCVIAIFSMMLGGALGALLGMAIVGLLFVIYNRSES
jgi:hypothetical protein